jgi:hypothetical protein
MYPRPQYGSTSSWESYWSMTTSWGPYAPVLEPSNEWREFVKAQHLQAEAERQRAAARREAAERTRPRSQGATRGNWQGEAAGKHPGYRQRGGL